MFLKQKKQPAFTKFYGSAAIYAINPVDEKTATFCAESLEVGYIQSWNAENFIKKFSDNIAALPAPDDIPDSEEDELAF